MKRMYLELSKFTDKQLDSLREDLNTEGKRRMSEAMRKLHGPVRSSVPLMKCMMMLKPLGGKWWERKPQ